MNRQSVLLTAVITFLLALILVASSYYFIQPMLQPELSQPEAAPAEPSPEDSVDTNLVSVSRSMIMDAADSPFAPRDVARNPFMWPGEQDQLLAAAEQEEEASQQQAESNATAGEDTGPQHDLKVVMVGEVGKMAVIDRKMVFEGDTVGNSTVTSIEPLEVVMVNDKQETITLTMNRAPQMVRFRKPKAPEGRQQQPAQSAPQQPDVPSEQGSSAEKMEYLLQEIQQMQGS
ncbi:MAG: hypothetical protein ACQESV_09630 [Thermodesulfobacteriota bacterium]